MGGVVEVVLPVFALIGLGFIAGRRALLPRAAFDGMSAFVFGLAAPSLIFLGGTRPHDSAGGAAAALLTGGVLVFLLATWAGRRFFRMGLSEAALFALACVFGNSLMMGVPIIVAAFGQAGVPPMLGILALQTMVLLGLATIVTEMGLNEHAPWRRVAVTTVRGVARNPVVMAVVAALVWTTLGLTMPGPMERTLELLGNATPAVALFCLGGGLSAISGRAAWAETLTIIIVKLVALPGLVWLIAIAIGATPIETAVAVTMSALPTGANAFIFARRYTIGMDRSGAAVVITTALSVLTLSALIGHFRGVLP
ncbi:AEC family transporter [Roseomonas stagni]|uniref:AEC family transporter n=1 Tax=Falsiroseomonas algicola TaxID=2716930 RepID=A0A6M1LLK1_9PROT|nr:AEC family transporter [Falsiroseomonas algicola]NGM21208.1 AEC family transporter [Falsiroseomonas algicola]